MLHKDEVVYTLALHMAKVDGFLSDDEESKLSKNPILKKITKDIDLNKIEKKIDDGDLTLESSIEFIKFLDVDEQIDILSIMWHIVICDGLMENKEKKLMEYMLKELDIELRTVSNRLQEVLV
jgi:uncharacterized tellurite resistance protein B-like protein